MRAVIEVLAAVLNSLWQAALVAALAWLALRLLKPINAATRYAIWWGVLVVTLALPAAPKAIAWWHTRAQQAPAVAPRVVAPRSNIAPLIEEQPAFVTLKEQRAARWPAWVLAGWALLFLYKLLQIGRSYLYLRGVKRRASASPTLLPAIVRPARLLLSSDIASPMAVGFLHPAVILPESLPGELAQPEMEHVLLHEAAHIARRDDWTNLLARLLGAALALHPVAWWILRQIEREREIACDDWVVARTGSARPYAQSLARMSELRWAKRGTAQGTTQGEALASGMLGGGSRFGDRIELLLERGRVFSAGASRVGVGASGIALLACLMGGALTPRWIAFAQARPSFDVASVKPNLVQAGSELDTRGRTIWVVDPGIVSATHVPLSSLASWAYGLQSYQLSGDQGWIKSDAFDIQAKPNVSASKEQMMSMMQSLLADRFKLKVHRETKALPAYSLTTDARGAKVHAGPVAGVPGNSVLFAMAGKEMRLTGKQAPMPQLTLWLTSIVMQSGRPVLDKTGLTGGYDFQLQWLPEDGPGGEAALTTALREQLGLDLKATKEEVEVLVIDHAEKPDAN